MLARKTVTGYFCVNTFTHLKTVQSRRQVETGSFFNCINVTPKTPKIPHSHKRARRNVLCSNCFFSVAKTSSTLKMARNSGAVHAPVPPMTPTMIDGIWTGNQSQSRIA